MERKASLTNGDECLETCDLELSSNDLPHVRCSTLTMRHNILHIVVQVILSLQEPLQLAEPKKFPSPPLYRREATISVVLEKSRPRVTKHSWPCQQKKNLSWWKWHFVHVLFVTLTCVHRHQSLSQGSSQPVMAWHLAPPPFLRSRLSLHPPLGEP